MEIVSAQPADQTPEDLMAQSTTLHDAWIRSVLKIDPRASASIGAGGTPEAAIARCIDTARDEVALEIATLTMAMSGHVAAPESVAAGIARGLDGMFDVLRDQLSTSIRTPDAARTLDDWSKRIGQDPRLRALREASSAFAVNTAFDEILEGMAADLSKALLAAH